MLSVPFTRLMTDRLVLRPTVAADSDRALEIRSDWEVTRMLSAASFPPDRQHMNRWCDGHRREWMAGEAYRFAVDLDGRMIGIVDIDGVAEGEGELGYWFDRVAWGQGYAFEAAEAVTRFASEQAGLLRLKAGHAGDNPASGRILVKLGFHPLDSVERFSRSRGQTILQRRYLLVFPRARGAVDRP